MPQTAVVTGASGGIGSAVARELAGDHDVVVQYHSDESGARSVAADIESDDGNAVTRQCDVSDRAAVREFFAAVRDSSDGVDVLVNNAGVAPSGSPFADRDTESIDRTIQVNLVGAMCCTQEVLDGMADRGYGRVVNVASTAGVHGSPSDPVYSASKGGLVAFTKSLARRYTEDGIRSNAVAPTVTDTPMIPEDRRETAADLFPEGRIVDPEDVASAVRYLVSEAYDSGKVIEVAGGRYL